MLNKEKLRCGLYDSLVSQKYKGFTPQRTVVRYEIELYHTDSGVSFVDGQAFPVRRGMLLCARPGQRRHSQLPIRSSYVWVPAEESDADILAQLPLCTYIEDPEALEELFRCFARLHRCALTSAPEPEGTVEFNLHFLALLQLCLQVTRGSTHRPVRNRLIREAYRYMDAHYCESCTLAQIAESAHVSANHLHTVFLESEGFTPYDYITKKRIEKAKTLILMEALSMAQIALETGFCSQSHFTAVFKKQTGMTPVRYKKLLFTQPDLHR